MKTIMISNPPVSDGLSRVDTLFFYKLEWDPCMDHCNCTARYGGPMHGAIAPPRPRVCFHICMPRPCDLFC